MSEQDRELIKKTLQRVRSNLTITKVVATRSVKTSKGDFFAGISASWNSVQDDGAGADLDLLTTTGEQASSGMTLMDAKVAQLIVSMEASIGAWRAALSEGAISVEAFEAREKEIKTNTLAHLNRLLPAKDAQAKLNSV